MRRVQPNLTQVIEFVPTRIIACDIETNGLGNDATIVWVVCCEDIRTKEQWTFIRPDKEPKALEEFARTVRTWVFHNGIAFDCPVLKRLVPSVLINEDAVLDTLIISRLFRYDVQGGHSLDAWSQRLHGPRKVEHEDWTQFSEAMVHRCVVDTSITASLFRRFEKHIERDEYKDAVQLEHKAAQLSQKMHENGFCFDIEGAKELHSELTRRSLRILEELQQDFKSKPSFIRVINPKCTKFGTISKVDFRWTDDLTPFSANCPFSLIEWEPFNPDSPKQIVQRLNQAGWKPFDKTKGHIEYLKLPKRQQDNTRLEHFLEFGWKVNEANLETLPQNAPKSAHKLREYIILSSRVSTLVEWISAYRASTGRIHGIFTPIGSWTGRMSHSKPNMANIPRIQFDSDGPILGLEGGFAHEMRSLFKVPEGALLVGVDAEGIQLRVLAHKMDDVPFTNAIVSGRKEDGTDVHTLNMKALNVTGVDRDMAKTFIYSWLLGAGIGKSAVVLNCSMEESKRARDDFVKSYPGLKRLKEKLIPQDAAKGYFIGLDKRLVPCHNEHLMLAGYLQNGESVIMKLANVLWHEQLTKEGIQFKQVDFVHDEWQTECYTMEDAQRIASVQKEAIAKAGVLLNMKCALSGSSSIGLTWADTH